MTYCSKCGKKNDDDAEFCSKCGLELNNKENESTFEKNVKKTGRLIEEKAEEIGKSFEKAGKRFEIRIENSFKGFQKWYDNKFKFVGPLIWSFLGLIILRIIIVILDYSGNDIQVFDDIGEFLYSYLLILFGLMLINTYNSYLNRIYKKQYRMIMPAISTISCVISLWIVSKILIILDTNLDIQILTTIANFIENYLVLIFVAVLLLSYCYVILILPYTKDITHK